MAFASFGQPPLVPKLTSQACQVPVHLVCPQAKFNSLRSVRAAVLTEALKAQLSFSYIYDQAVSTKC